MYDQIAEDWADKRRSGKKVAHEYLEKPAMYAKLPELNGLRVLCLGCGSGEECKYLQERGAADVVGIDLSRGLIEQAKYAYPDCKFEVMDMQRLSFNPESFDFVYSSLALHYAEDLAAVYSGVARVLKRGGKFLFSTHHPVKWAAEKNKTKDGLSYTLGFARFESGAAEVHGNYLDSYKVTDNIGKDLEVSFYSRPVSEFISLALRNGFELVDFLEPKPLAAAAQEKPDFWQVHQKIPLFMIFELLKK